MELLAHIDRRNQIIFVLSLVHIISTFLGFLFYLRNLFARKGDQKHRTMGKLASSLLGFSCFLSLPILYWRFFGSDFQSQQAKALAAFRLQIMIFILCLLAQSFIALKNRVNFAATRFIQRTAPATIALAISIFTTTYSTVNGGYLYLIGFLYWAPLFAYDFLPVRKENPGLGLRRHIRAQLNLGIVLVTSIVNFLGYRIFGPTPWIDHSLWILPSILLPLSYLYMRKPLLEPR